MTRFGFVAEDTERSAGRRRYWRAVPQDVRLPRAPPQTRSRGAALAGPPRGGLLFGLDRALPFVVDAVSHLLAAAALLVIRRDLQTKATGPPEPRWQATLTGLRWVSRHPVVGSHARRPSAPATCSPPPPARSDASAR